MVSVSTRNIDQASSALRNRADEKASQEKGASLGARVPGYKDLVDGCPARGYASVSGFKAAPVRGSSLLECKMGGKCGGAYDDSDAAMDTLAGAGSDDADIARFLRSSYSYEDAERAVEAFDFLQTVPEAKAYIGMKIANGTESILDEVGITPHPFDAHEELAAFTSSKYSVADAKRALAAFDFLSDIEDAKRYIGLKIINGAEDILSEVGITSKPWDSHELLDLYHASNYTTADADKLARNADFISNRREAKEYIGLKIANGAEDLLSNWGVEPRASRC